MLNRISVATGLTLLMLACTHENDRPMTPANGTTTEPNPSGTNNPSTTPSYGADPNQDPSAPNSDIDNPHSGDSNGAQPAPMPGAASPPSSGVLH